MAPLRHDPSNPKCRYTDDWSADESTDFCSCPPAERVMDAAPAPGGWTPELRQLEREYDEANHAAHAAHDGFEEGLIRAASEAWERFSRAVKRQHA